MAAYCAGRLMLNGRRMRSIASITGDGTLSTITVKLNGVVILDDAEIKGKTGGARNEPEGTPGLLRLQGHGNPTQFRNIWVVDVK